MRREFPAKVKAEAFKRAGGACEACTRKLFAGDIHYDHRNPDALTGEPTLANCQVLCRSCHSAKTRDDVKDISRAKRREARHLGAHRAKRLIPGSKGTAFRKHIDGTVTRRQED